MTFESITVEYKERLTPEVRRSVVAFANTDGGTQKDKAKQSNSDEYIRNIVKDINQMKPESAAKASKSTKNTK